MVTAGEGPTDTESSKARILLNTLQHPGSPPNPLNNQAQKSDVLRLRSFSSVIAWSSPAGPISPSPVRWEGETAQGAVLCCSKTPQ